MTMAMTFECIVRRDECGEEGLHCSHVCQFTRMHSCTQCIGRFTSVNTVRSASVGELLQLTIEATASLAAVPQVSECHANEHEQRPSCEKHEWHTRVQILKKNTSNTVT